MRLCRLTAPISNCGMLFGVRLTARYMPILYCNKEPVPSDTHQHKHAVLIGMPAQRSRTGEKRSGFLLTFEIITDLLAQGWLWVCTRTRAKILPPDPVSLPAQLPISKNVEAYPFVFVTQVSRSTENT